MKPNARNRSRYGTFRMRMAIYAFLIAFVSIPVLWELKTGIPVGKGRAYRPMQDERSWGEVWTELLQPERLPLYLALFVVLIVAMELWVRFGKTPEDADEDAADESSEARAKPLTRVWLVATIGYAAVVAAVYTAPGSDWAATWTFPLPAPLVALSPILVSLALLAMYTGKITLKQGTLYRSRSPVIYWMTVALIMALAVFLFLAGLGIIGNVQQPTG